MRTPKNSKTPVERLRSFLEIEDDELAQMSVDDLREELRLLGIEPTELPESVRLRLLDARNASQPLHDSASPLKNRARTLIIGIVRFLQVFSKTDQALVSRCSRLARMSQTSIGTIVLLSGLIAVASFAVAVYAVFHSITAALLLGFVSGGIVVTLNREMVSVPRKTRAIPQLFCAILLGLVISAPVELKVFESRINQQLAISSAKEMKAVFDSQNEEFGMYDAKVYSLQRDVEDYRAGIRRSMEAMEAESIGKQGINRTGLAGHGPVYAEAEKLRDNYQRLLSQSEMELRQLEAERDAHRSIAMKNASARTQSMPSDFLAKREALGQLQAISFTASSMIWAIRLLFILIEGLPIALSLLMPATDYLAIVEAERRKAIARVNAIANEQLADIMNNPYSAPVPITALAANFGDHRPIHSEQPLPA